MTKHTEADQEGSAAKAEPVAHSVKTQQGVPPAERDAGDRGPDLHKPNLHNKEPDRGRKGSGEGEIGMQPGDGHPTGR